MEMMGPYWRKQASVHVTPSFPPSPYVPDIDLHPPPSHSTHFLPFSSSLFVSTLSSGICEVLQHMLHTMMFSLPLSRNSATKQMEWKTQALKQTFPGFMISGILSQ